MAKGFLSLGSLSSFGCLAAVDVLQVFTGAGTTVCFQGFASELGSLKQRNSFKKKHLHFYMESVFFFCEVLLATQHRTTEEGDKVPLRTRRMALLTWDSRYQAQGAQHAECPQCLHVKSSSFPSQSICPVSFGCLF